MTKMTKKVLALAILAVFLVLDVAYEVNFTKLNELQVYTKKLQKDTELRIFQISDLHGRNRLNAKLEALAVRSRPDIIVITGDLVDVHTASYSRSYNLINNLKKMNKPIYFVPGNHEQRSGRLTELLDNLKAMGVNILQNSGSTIDVHGSRINICGVDDPYTRNDDIESAMSGMDESLYTLLLSHSPRIVDRLRGNSPDLILCGHTHGGQVRLPLIGAVAVPGEGLFPKIDKGIFKLDEAQYMYVDSGAGTSTLPLRFLDRSQVSLIRIAL